MRALITTATICIVCLVVVSAPFFWFASPFLLLPLVPALVALCVVWIGNERPKFRPSDIYSSKRDYVSWNSINGWPREDRLFYECGICHQTLPSEPKDVVTCACGNLFVGPKQIGAQDPSRVLLFQQDASNG